jgi:hypothetical protein
VRTLYIDNHSAYFIELLADLPEKTTR